MRDGCYKALVLLFLAALVVLACLDLPSSSVVEPRKLIRVVSIAPVSQYEGEYWAVDYAMDGEPYSILIPAAQGPSGFVEYLRLIGEVQD